MDIRSLIDSDASNTSKAPPKALAPSPTTRREDLQQYRQIQDIPQSPYDVPPGNQLHRETRPPQPPPLRPPPHGETRSPSASSFNSVLSPYQKTPSSGLSAGGQYPFPPYPGQSPAHSGYTAQYSYHEGQPASVGVAYPGHGQSTSLPHTPSSTTPGGSHAFAQQQRPPSSHSASTPTSGHNQTPNIFRDSPQQSDTQIRGQPFSNTSQQHPSQPATPLGPPSTLGRQNAYFRRESPNSREHKRNNSGGFRGQPAQSNYSLIGNTRNPPTPSPMAYSPAQSSSYPSEPVYSSMGDRERSLSVSPKTQPSIQPRAESSWNQARAPGSHSATGKRKLGDFMSEKQSFTTPPSAKRSMSLGVGDMLNTPRDDGSSRQSHLSEIHYNKFASVPEHGEAVDRRGQYSTTSDSNQPISHVPPTLNRSSNTLGVMQSSAVGRFQNEPSPIKSEMIVKEEGQSENVSSARTSETIIPQRTADSPPKLTKKRIRYREVPIFAQSYRKYGRSGKNRQQTLERNLSFAKQEPQQPPSQSIKMENPNDHSERAIPGVQPDIDAARLLGSWEPTITNVIPSEELTRGISDHLFSIVYMNGVEFGPAGAKAGRGAMVEIEAKIGQIIDKDTNDRIRIPVSTECLLSRTDPNLRTAFRSSMTEAQHRKLNGFLNKALVDSKPPLPGQPLRTKPRVPLTYVHTYETDTFFELSQNAFSALPPSLHRFLDKRKPPKVRITTDQKTGKELAKILKVRVSDIEIYSPQTPFDWRVSVSLEVSYEGPMRDLVESTEKPGKRPDRNKDRVSYRHSHYQIDLTQVTPAEATSRTEKEHELEIEVSSAAIRDQGQLAMEGKPNAYEDLVKGFVDNVRVLTRSCRE